MASLGAMVLVADPLGLDRLLPADAVPKITLLVLSTVTLFLLLEVERFQLLDNIDARLSELDIATIAQKLKYDHYAGIMTVHPRFPEDKFIKCVDSAEEVAILNTWIPNLHRFEQSIIAALNRRAGVRILLLNPHSNVTRLRDEALRPVRDPSLADNVRDGVMRSLAILESITKVVGERRVAYLQVRLYNSLPSIAVYRADAHFFVSSFLHGQLAIDSPQLEIDGADTVVGGQVKKEFDTLWGIGEKIDVRNWRMELDQIR